MNRFENQLSRMQSLMTYGMVSESDSKNGNIEYSKVAADGKSYGIIRECNKFYIKVADADKATIAEAYEYIGGFNNKKDFEYTGYNNALKNFDLKMMSINEAFDATGNATTLDPSKKENLVIEGTDAMKNEIARQRQIMMNAAGIITEGSYNIAGVGNAEKHGAPYGEKEAMGKEADVKDSEIPSEGKSVAAQDGKKEGTAVMYKGKELKEGCEMEPYCQEVNETEEEKFELPQAKEEVDGAKQLCEEDDEEIEISNEDILPDEEPAEESDFEEEPEIDAEPEMGEEPEVEPEMDTEEDFEEEIPMQEPAVEPEEGDLEARIAELESELAALKAQMEGEEPEMEPEAEDFEEEPAEEIEGEEEFEAEPEGEESEEEFEAEPESEDFEEEEPEEFDDEEIDECGKPMYESKSKFMNSIVESVVRQIMNEDELHDFGKHPGYRKKPMTLPAVGSDEENGMRDWNDASVHSDAPFGQKIGDGKPYDKAVKMITDSIMETLKKKM